MKKVLAILGISLLSTTLLVGCSSESKIESSDTNNQSVYKTVDFNSYSGEVSSTDFNDLIDKKVTFTNVPTLGGTLGNMNKGFSCRNESSLVIEDNVTYTLTGIVTNTTGTYMVSLKDCTLTKN